MPTFKVKVTAGGRKKRLGIIGGGARAAVERAKQKRCPNCKKLNPVTATGCANCGTALPGRAALSTLPWLPGTGVGAAARGKPVEAAVRGGGHFLRGSWGAMKYVGLGFAKFGKNVAAPFAGDPKRGLKTALWRQVYVDKVTFPIKERLPLIVAVVVGAFLSISIFNWIPNLWLAFLFALFLFMSPSKDKIYKDARDAVDNKEHKVRVPEGLFLAAGKQGINPDMVLDILKQAESLGLSKDDYIDHLINAISGTVSLPPPPGGGPAPVAAAPAAAPPPPPPGPPVPLPVSGNTPFNCVNCNASIRYTDLVNAGQCPACGQQYT